MILYNCIYSLENKSTALLRGFSSFSEQPPHACREYSLWLLNCALLAVVLIFLYLTYMLHAQQDRKSNLALKENAIAKASQPTHLRFLVSYSAQLR